jgi:hypothetical protein
LSIGLGMSYKREMTHVGDGPRAVVAEELCVSQSFQKSKYSEMGLSGLFGSWNFVVERGIARRAPILTDVRSLQM